MKQEFGFNPVGNENHMEIFNLKGDVIQSVFLERKYKGLRTTGSTGERQTEFNGLVLFWSLYNKSVYLVLGRNSLH